MHGLLHDALFIHTTSSSRAGKAKTIKGDGQMKIIIAALIALIAYEFYIEAKRHKERKERDAYMAKIEAEMEQEIDDFLSGFNPGDDGHADD